MKKIRNNRHGILGGRLPNGGLWGSVLMQRTGCTWAGEGVIHNSAGTEHVIPIWVDLSGYNMAMFNMACRYIMASPKRHGFDGRGSGMDGYVNMACGNMRTPLCIVPCHLVWTYGNVPRIGQNTTCILPNGGLGAGLKWGKPMGHNELRDRAGLWHGDCMLNWHVGRINMVEPWTHNGVPNRHRR